MQIILNLLFTLFIELHKSGLNLRFIRQFKYFSKSNSFTYTFMIHLFHVRYANAVANMNLWFSKYQK